MARLYLITGFLGAGKTSFLRAYLEQLSARAEDGERFALIINEFGREGIDAALLSDVGAWMTEIVNGSIFCVCRLADFERALDQALAEPDVGTILVESSGLSDPTQVRKILSDEARWPGLDFRGTICLVDARRFPAVYQTCRVVTRQLAVADVLVINKVDQVDETKLAALHALLDEQRPDLPRYETTYGAVTDEMMAGLITPEATRDLSDGLHVQDLTLRKYLLTLAAGLPRAQLERMLARLGEASYRVKGFVEVDDGSGTARTALVSCVGAVCELSWEPASPVHLNQLVMLAGRGLGTRRAIDELRATYPDGLLDSVVGD